MRYLASLKYEHYCSSEMHHFQRYELKWYLIYCIYLGHVGFHPMLLFPFLLHGKRIQTFRRNTLLHENLLHVRLSYNLLHENHLLVQLYYNLRHVNHLHLLLYPDLLQKHTYQAYMNLILQHFLKFLQNLLCYHLIYFQVLLQLFYFLSQYLHINLECLQLQLTHLEQEQYYQCYQIIHVLFLLCSLLSRLLSIFT